jgi:alcohol dehydrogenase class IV
MTYTFSFPTIIHFGAGVRHQVAAALKNKSLKNPLVVTDRGVVQQDFFGEFVNELGREGLKPAIFSEIFGNPVKTQVTAGVNAYKDNNSDSIIAIGGGAVLDVAKAIALMVTHPGDLFDYEDGKPDALPVNNEIPFWVAMPTTSGTGSEVGRSAVVSDDETHLKKIIFSPKLLAPVVFADPELTLKIPAHITAATGMDALTHLVEAYLAKGYHPICDGIALEGLHIVAKNLARAVHHPDDLDARSQMMMASMMGAIAFQKGLGIVHSCAHALSTVADLHHGLANGLMIDYALKFNVSEVPERFARMASAIGLEQHTAESFFNWLDKLKKEINIPLKLSDVNIAADKIDRLIDVSVKDVCHQSNPKAVSEGDFRRIFSEAL